MNNRNYSSEAGGLEMMQSVLKVYEKLYLTPHYIRVVLEGDMSIYSKARIGDNNKILIPKNGTKTVEINNKSQFDKEISKPVMRTYTLRAIDYQRNLMTIDFVAHGENGPASTWAINAEKGDELGVFMKTKSKPLFINSENYLIVGDHTALPVISIILEQLPKDSHGSAIIEVYGPEDVLDINKPQNVNILWVFNNTPGEKSNLINAVKNNDTLNNKNTFVFAAAEQNAVKEIQKYLREETQLERQQWQVLSYWKFGQSEDSSSQERREISHRE